VDVPTLRNGLSGPTGSGNYYSNVEFVIVVHRNFLYYVWKVLCIVYLLIMSMFVCFCMEAVDDFADRINICLTLFLAAVAFLYVVGESLPKVPYLTLLDKLMLISFLFIFLGGLESLVSRNYARSSPSDPGLVDTVALIVFPLAYFGLNFFFLVKGLRYRFKLMNARGEKEVEQLLSTDSKLQQAQTTAPAAAAASTATTNPITAGAAAGAAAGASAEAADVEVKVERRMSRRNTATVLQQLAGTSTEKLHADELEREEREKEAAQIVKLAEAKKMASGLILGAGLDSDSSDKATRAVLVSEEAAADDAAPGSRRTSVKRRVSISSAQKY
jgi:hypothetical protein